MPIQRILSAFIKVLLRLPGPLLLRLAGERPLVLAGRTLDPRIQFFARLARFGSCNRPLLVTEARKASFPGLTLLDGRPRRMAHIADRRISGPAGDIPIRVYTPNGLDGPAPVLVFFHFGGCVIGDLETCHTACSMIADRARCVVVSVAYRLAPEHKFPAAVDDASAAFRWVAGNAEDLGGDPARVGVAGDSAGGYLAAAVCLDMRRQGDPAPKVQVLIYPVTDMARAEAPPTPFDNSYPLSRQEMAWFAEQYLSHPDEASNPRCSVLRTGSLAGLPRAIVILAGHDLLHDEGRRFADRLRGDGVPTVCRSYDNLAHAFTAMTGAIPAARQAVLDIAEDIGAALRS